jgi:hypothetical protein
MPDLNVYDDAGRVLCRYCRFATLSGDHLECRAGDGGPVVADIAECELGERVGESRIAERTNLKVT